MTHLSYITLYVARDALGRVSDWYTQHLGLAVQWGSADFILLGGGEGAALGLHAGDPLAEAEKVQLHFMVPDVDAAYARLMGEGVTFQHAPKDTPWGYRVATTLDPAGHTVELYTEI